VCGDPDQNERVYCVHILLVLCVCVCVCVQGGRPDDELLWEPAWERRSHGSVRMYVYMYIYMCAGEYIYVYIYR